MNDTWNHLVDIGVGLLVGIFNFNRCSYYFSLAFLTSFLCFWRSCSSWGSSTSAFVFWFGNLCFIYRLCWVIKSCLCCCLVWFSFCCIISLWLVLFFIIVFLDELSVLLDCLQVAFEECTNTDFDSILMLFFDLFDKFSMALDVWVGEAVLDIL